jgi:tripartite-type tricarboxylate transporter receptor subunit TctC
MGGTLVKKQAALGVGLALFALLESQARADETFPSRAIRIVASYAPGGTPDTIARLIAEQLSVQFKQTVFVENRPGANGAIATENIASSPADGYSLLLASDGPVVIMPLLKKGSADPLGKLVPVNLTAESAFVLMARNNLNVKDLKTLIELASTEKLTYGSAGVGSQHHLAGELLKSRAGIELIHVPYKGAAEVLADLMGQRLDLGFGGVPPSTPYIAGGNVRPIAVTSEARNQKIPSVPTFSELGYPGYRVVFWVGIMAPAGTPPAIINKLNDAITVGMKSPDATTKLEKLGVDLVNLGPAEFARRLEADKKMWGELINQTGLRQ